jgi:hypothetical protein
MCVKQMLGSAARDTDREVFDLVVVESARSSEARSLAMAGS